MSAPPWTNHNSASSGSHVDQQIGVNYGDTAFHRYETIYNVTQTDPPERKEKVALNHLEGGNSRFAESILGELLRTGHATTSRAYYYALSVLSDRSLNEIDRAEYEDFGIACRAAEGFPVDGWSVALNVVRQFMSCMWKQDKYTPVDTEEMRKVLDAFDRLPEARRGEITRHLRMVLGGAVQERLDVEGVQRVVTERLQPNRGGRAWKFFQPEPAEPRPVTLAAPAIPQETWFKIVGGGFGVLIGLLVLLSGIGGAASFLAVPPLAAGGYLVVRNGVERAQLVIRRRRMDYEHGVPYLQRQANSPGHWVSTEFVKDVFGRVETCFREARPHVAGDWLGDTAGLREYLKGRFVHLYGNAQVTPASINWLIRWHANQVAKAWLAGTLYAYQVENRESSRTTTLFRLGIGVSAVGLLVLFGSGAGAVAVIIAAAGYFGVTGAVELLAARRDHEEARADCARRYEDEKVAYADWVRLLADRPTDAEMGRWLDLDKAFLKTAALRRVGLDNRDLVAYVVMTEGTPKAMRARVPHGPPRFSEYVVLVFLLTKSGVREVEVDLDFLTGTTRDERRTSFRYEHLVSARVSEVGIRYADDRRVIVEPGEPQGPLEIEKVRSRALRLTLASSQEITVVAANFAGLTDGDLEQESELVRIALLTSGIAGALSILEAVAAEGADWITREQERRERRSRDWRDGGGGEIAGPDFGALL
ncbi:hypothetical protein [Umezawaea sp. NPDC059074]|uniref:hypothetical protein n=1 Tax=Umezawaea sp. NPDC059074 TaxID=3346716 RepID=UPI00368CA925